MSDSGAKKKRTKKAAGGAAGGDGVASPEAAAAGAKHAKPTEAKPGEIVDVEQANAARPRVELYTDGACSGNPGPGGWAFVLKHPASGSVKERFGAELDTTNNRMELMAAIEGLRALKASSSVDLYSDSQYVLNGLKEWMDAWKGRGWRTADKKPVKNRELWEILDDLRSKHTIRFHWVRGHSEHPENERCDELAVAAREALVGR
jgi:ribonuclease HI